MPEPRRTDRLYLIPLSGLSYIAGGQVILALLAFRTGLDSFDYRACVYIALILSLLVWIMGVPPAVTLIQMRTQMAAWPLGVAFAALHGMGIMLIISIVADRGFKGFGAAVGLSGMGGLAAALAYSFFLFTVFLLNR